MRTFAIVAGLLLFTFALHAGERAAIVIGNRDYTEAGRFPDLRTSAADARTMHGLLGAAGFRMAEPVIDATRVTMRDRLIDFAESLEAGDEAVVYFAGHGVQYENKVWLMGTNAEFRIKAELSEEAMSHEAVAGLLGERGVKIAVILLDCCREVPDQSWLASENRQRGLRGTETPQLTPPPNILVGFATSSERLANDNLNQGDANGPLVDALRRHWDEGLEFDPLWKAVAREVFTRSRTVAGSGSGVEIQMPSKYGQTIHDFFFVMNAAKGRTTPPMAAPATEPPDEYDAFAGVSHGERRLVEVAPGVAVPFRWCPPGTFDMGSPQTEKDLLKAAGEEDRIFSGETLHEVTLTRGFWLAETEVTQGQWQAVMGSTLLEQVRQGIQDDTLLDLAGKRQTLRDFLGLPRDADPSSIIGPESENTAMYWVSHDDSEDWCSRASRHAALRGWKVALPTEAQWEYACRAGTSGATYAGDFRIEGRFDIPLLDEIAWYAGNSSQGYSGKGWSMEGWPEMQYSGGTAGPRRVGGKRPNPWGLLDMLGNVWEWTADRHSDYPARPVTDPVVVSQNPRRALRGGSWRCGIDCRAAHRNQVEPGFRNTDLGFRPALVPSR